MRVYDVLKAEEINGVSPAVRTERVGRAEEKKDMVALSNASKDYQAVKKALAQVPDVRQEKADAIKSRIDGGTYDVRPADIANKMLSFLWQ